MAMYKGAASEAGRALHLQKKREKAKIDLELRKKKIEEELKLSSIDNKFAAHYDAIEAQLKTSTVGLMSLTEMKAKQEDFVKERERKMVQKNEQLKLKEIQEKKEQKERQKRQIQTLSFRYNDDEEIEDEDENENENEEKGEEEGKDEKKRKIERKVNDRDENKDKVLVKNEIQKTNEEDSSIKPSLMKGNEYEYSNCQNFAQAKKKKKMIKNPEVDTSFLPDREREKEEEKLREELRQQWVEKQEKLKNEEIEITFSYWDGSGHRRSAKMKKGNTIYQFLHKTLELLRKEFHELRAVTADQLMYVKEDLIIPHHYTFYDFIVTKARGKSGPLFNFDVHEDIRLLADSTVEKDESHAGKVLIRNWYERNKHIFPASRWEPYDPSKNYEKYTVSDKKFN